MQYGQGWAPRSFLFRTFCSFPLFFRVFGDLGDPKERNERNVLSLSPIKESTFFIHQHPQILSLTFYSLYIWILLSLPSPSYFLLLPPLSLLQLNVMPPPPLPYLPSPAPPHPSPLEMPPNPDHFERFTGSRKKVCVSFLL